MNPHNHSDFINEYQKKTKEKGENFETLSMLTTIAECIECQDYIYFNFSPKQKWDLYTEGVLRFFNRNLVNQIIKGRNKNN